MTQIEIHNRSIPDPIAGIPIVDAYMLWALLAAEEVVGKPGLNALLRQGGLERLLENYPTSALTATGHFVFSDYANLSTSLLTFYGHAGKSLTLRIGRLSARHGIDRQGQLFGLSAMVAVRILPISMQIRMGLEAMQAGYRAMMPQMKHYVEDHGDKWAYVSETCPMCAGKEANEPICWIYNGVLEEACRWQTDKDFAIEEVACRATGAATCIWEVAKQPREQRVDA